MSKQHKGWRLYFWSRQLNTKLTVSTRMFLVDIQKDFCKWAKEYPGVEFKIEKILNF
jgi:hypothetical protein